MATMVGAPMKHRNDIDGRQAIAVASVLCYHGNSAWLRLRRRRHFLVISRFLISNIILAVKKTVPIAAVSILQRLQLLSGQRQSNVAVES
jgi:peptidoglycan/LPS O-acetylase OafA/YrhL